MAVLTGDSKSERKQGVVYALPAAGGTHIYSGALVCINAAGYAVPAANAAGNTFLGVARMESNNTGGANGALTAEGYLKGIFSFSAPGVTTADMVKEAYVVDDNTLGLGVAAQPVNATGVTVHRTALSRGGSQTLAFTATGTLLAYGGGTAVNVGAGGDFTLTAADGGSIMVSVTASGLPGADKTDAVQLRHVKVGRIIEVSSSGTAFVEIATAARS
jgi:hypothetical protein